MAPRKTLEALVRRRLAEIVGPAGPAFAGQIFRFYRDNHRYYSITGDETFDLSDELIDLGMEDRYLYSEATRAAVREAKENAVEKANAMYRRELRRIDEQVDGSIAKEDAKEAARGARQQFVRGAVAEAQRETAADLLHEEVIYPILVAAESAAEALPSQLRQRSTFVDELLAEDDVASRSTAP